MLKQINGSEKEVRKEVCGKSRYDFGKCYIPHPTSRKSEARRSWKILMNIIGGESLKQKLGLEIRFQEEIYRVDQWSREIRT